jgi:hypothetical protein
MDIKQYIDKRSYSKIEKYIQECFKRFHEIYIQFFENEITTITKITLNDINIKNLISESKIMFENLIYLYNKIPHDELYDKLKFKENVNFVSIFINRMKSYHTSDYEMYKKEFESEISSDKWSCIYISWLINSNVFFNKRYENYKLLKLLFPKLFEEYPIDDFLRLMNIYDAVEEEKE